jgi:hypothetical protein
MPLKLLLVSVDETVGHNNHINMDIARDLGRLARELAPHGVTTALWSNRDWRVNKSKTLAEWFSDIAQTPVLLHGMNTDGSPARRRKDSAVPIMQRYGAQRHETALVGGVDEDMIAGVQNGLLMLRPDWYGQHTEYGFSVPTISDLARFCFVFALRQHPIFWKVQDGSLDVSAAGPFSTMRAAYQMFGEDARAFAKGGHGNPDFWFNFAVSSLYFSGMLEGVDYICSYPGHTPQSDVNKFGMAEVLSRLGKCFRRAYFHDLIVRHDAAQKSQPIRAADRTFLNQLNTIRLSKRPHPYLGAEQRKTPIQLNGKTVLVVDDFCTSGRSNEAARAFIEAAGGRARLFSWLKTISAPYCRIAHLQAISPFEQNALRQEPAKEEYSYAAHIVAADAPAEIQNCFTRYRTWHWG